MGIGEEGKEIRYYYECLSALKPYEMCLAIRICISCSLFIEPQGGPKDFDVAYPGVRQE